MSARAEPLHGFVLHRRDYGDTSLLVEVFAARVGRFPAIARGARRPRSPHGALLQAFQPLWLETGGRGEVRTLRRVEGSGRAIPLAGTALVCGFYLNELLSRLLPRHDPHDDLLTFYQVALARLGAESEEPDRGLRQFELRLLAELGYGFALDRETPSGEPVRAERDYVYQADSGLTAWTADAVGTPIRGETLLLLARDLPLAGAQRREARDFLRAIIAPHLGGRPLHSRELMRRWPRRAMPPAAAIIPNDPTESLEHA